MRTTDAEEFPSLTQKRKRDCSLVFKRSGSDHRKWKREQDSRLPAAGSHEVPPHRAKRRRTGGGRGRDVYGSRRWVSSPRDLSSFRDRFIIVSYNILGVENASKHPDLYDRIDPQHLNWDTRKKQIHKELTCYNPSILCFQEVDRFNDLAYLLQKDGFVGVYKIRVLLERANKLSQEYGNTPVVISEKKLYTGNLSSCHADKSYAYLLMTQSAIHQFFTSSEIDILAYDRKKISGQMEFPVMNQGHDNTRDDNGEPLATSCHSKFMGTVDYIWHSSALVPVAVVETLPINVLKRLGGLPSEKWGSDHLALVCKFAFVDDANCSTFA
ncbi:putative Carbon catabolite repressor protein 4 [Cocos nucifera]|uniref:Putative Carbon catabolite repressor protein 4 n=1 Tax=Cocos nucifera TaxID=13894 RepID=A0A8K0I2V3_COCNU|nr:putative Carbon catabolite repressor protein 4 [Cocos nucifera]